MIAYLESSRHLYYWRMAKGLVAGVAAFGLEAGLYLASRWIPLSTGKLPPAPLASADSRREGAS